jgi:3-deoxy-D-manno-octulosonic-acid transferase
LLAYRWGTSALSPLVPLLLRRRAARGKEDRSRLRERFGHASHPRPAGQLIWIHGASVGECNAVLPLIGALLSETGRHILLTSGTVTSAKLMQTRLPEGASHQFAPVDTPTAVRRFLNHWRPSAAVFVDSEIWPNTLSDAHARGIPLVLVNGRMSERSFANWRRTPRLASLLLGHYSACFAQDRTSAERLSALGARKVEVSGNLKADAPPLPADCARLNELQGAIDRRPVLLAASTHPGEEETILPAHDILRREHANLLTVIVPRHPDRGSNIATLSGGRTAKLRSEGSLPDKDTQVYVADTIGELGLFYRLVPFAFIGGSLVPHGGQNPLEAAQLGCAVLAGSNTHNFACEYEMIFARQGVGRISTAGELARVASQLLAPNAETKTLGEAAASAAASLKGATEKTCRAIEMLLSHAAT